MWLEAATVAAAAVSSAQDSLAEQQRLYWESAHGRAHFLPYLNDPAPVYRHVGNCRNCGAPHEPVCSYCGTKQ
jgi:hypothetical protein